MAEHRGIAGVAGEESPGEDALDELDARIDYDRIAARSEADRAAGRLVAHGEVERRVEAWLRGLSARRRHT